MSKVENVYTKVGKKIKQTRIRRGLSQKEMAKLLNFNEISLCKLENGYGRIDLHTALVYSKKFKRPLDGLL